MVRRGSNLSRPCAVLREPFIPGASARMLAVLPAGHAFAPPDGLIARIAEVERQDWAKRFAGVRVSLPPFRAGRGSRRLHSNCPQHAICYCTRGRLLRGRSGSSVTVNQGSLSNENML